MRTLFAVMRTRGRAWDSSKSLREQQQWDEHALFMEKLAAQRFVLLGGLLGDGRDVLLVIDAASENEVASRLSEDPWSKSGLLEIKSVQTWNVLLEAGEK
ncbi:MAG TPA: hypothetical protein VID27_22425 [Blastocatellia bacterium]|jgi:hypothetical protein